LADPVDPGGVGKAEGARQPVRRQPLPVAQERIVFFAFGALARLNRRDQQVNGKARAGSTTAPQP